MSACDNFDRELSQHDDDAQDFWYDSGVVSLGQLAAALSDEDLVVLGVLWPMRPLRWQQHCAEVLGQARRAQAISLLLDMVERGSPEVSLTALETLREFDGSLFTAQQRQSLITSLEAAQALPIGDLHHLVLGAFLAKLRADEVESG